MNKCKKYDLDEIITFLKNAAPLEEEKKKYEGSGFGCMAVVARGMNGFSYNALLIPESIHIIVSPIGCGRHTDFDLMCEENYSERIYHIHLTEAEIVVGTAVSKVKDEVMCLIDSLEVKPKAVTMMITCMDALLHTDYSSVEKVLLEKYGIRFTLIKMFAFLNKSKVTHLMLLQQSMYSLLKYSGVRNEKIINMIGNTAPFSMKSDFIKVLAEAGYKVQEIRTCKTFEEYEQMGDARLNVILNPNSVYAAKDMEKKLGIPYVEFMECMDPEMIRVNYQALEKELGCKLNYEPYYEKAVRRAREFHELIKDRTFAIGNWFDYNAVKCAAEFAELGGKIKYVLIPEIKKEDLPYYERIKQKGNHTVFYLTEDYGFYHFAKEEDCQADVAVGLLALLVLGVFGPTHLMTGEEPFDFETFEETLEQMTKILTGGEISDRLKAEPCVYDRNWGCYEERV